MKHLAQTLSITLLLLICVVLGTAQSVAPIPSPKSKDKASVRIYRLYDKSKNQTITSAYPIPASGYPLGGLYINVYYTYPGKTPAVPQLVIIRVIAPDSELEYEDNRELAVKADGAVYRLGRMDYQKIPESGFGGFTGILSLTVPVEVFSRIASAKKVHIKLGSSDQDLEERDLKKWRALVGNMNQ
jgi:hypothetical protein